MHSPHRLQLVRAFSRSATVQTRRTIQEIRQSRLASPPGPEKPTPEELQKVLKRESERAFGPTIVGDPITFVNKATDDVWKDLLKASGNDPQIFKAWRDDIKSRSAMQTSLQRNFDSGRDPSGKQTTSSKLHGQPSTKPSKAGKRG
ncbi:hypothetical protein B0H19DRAFT_616777 [Mycena capillaripes]|nr:hypothetical protein B0H19DRAFT_616777 [Mycena capillaripes]